MKCLVFGATGLTGSELTNQLLELGHEVHCAVRTIGKTRGIEHTVDFSSDLIIKEQSFDHVFNCLGTTIKKAKSKEAFKDVDYNYSLKAFQYAKKSGAKTFCSISALGAKANSLFFYNQVKGQLEEALVNDDIKVILIRPGLLVGKREEFRLTEWISIKLLGGIGNLLPYNLKKYAPVKASIVAKTMIELTLTGETSIPLEHIIK